MSMDRCIDELIWKINSDLAVYYKIRQISFEMNTSDENHNIMDKDESDVVVPFRSKNKFINLLFMNT